MRRAGIAIGVVLLATALGVLALTRDGTLATYTVKDVISAFAVERVPVQQIKVPSRPPSSLHSFGISTDGDAYLAPTDNRFYVFVIHSDASAKKYFAFYAQDTNNPETFQLLEGKVIVESDASNSETPLPDPTRAKIRSAITRLRAQRNSA